MNNAVQGMTINERLSHFNARREFDIAVKSQNLDAVISILQRLELTAQSAKETAQTVLSNPKYYGY
jgi:hypothetical protein